MKTSQPIFKKSKYIKVNYFTEGKETKTYFVIPKDNKISFNNKTFLINPEHIYLSNKFKTIILTSKSSETIDPLNFDSKFNSDIFNSAINNKLIKDTFDTLDNTETDWLKVIMFANILVSAIMLFLLLKQGGII